MTIHATTVGDGATQTVFLHGLFGQGRNWNSIAKAVSDLTTSHLVDLPNHGASDWTESFELCEQAALVADWVRAHTEPPVALVGHSLGGKLAMLLTLDHPDLVERLMVVDISPVAADVNSTFEPLVGPLLSLDLNSLDSRSEADERLAPQIPDDTVRGFLLQNLRRDGDAWRWQANLELLAASLDQIGSWPSRQTSFDGPVLWVAGGRSSYVRPEYRDDMQRLFPRARLVTLKNAGHWVHSEQPEAFTALTREFLQS